MLLLLDKIYQVEYLNFLPRFQKMLLNSLDSSKSPVKVSGVGGCIFLFFSESNGFLVSRKVLLSVFLRFFVFVLLSNIFYFKNFTLLIFFFSVLLTVKSFFCFLEISKFFSVLVFKYFLSSWNLHIIDFVKA